MILSEEEKRGGKAFLTGAEDHKDAHSLAADAGEIGLADVLVVDEDVLSAGHDGLLAG